jgi:hypothetical protein
MAHTNDLWPRPLAAEACPPVPGYSLDVDKTRNGENLVCEARIGYETTAVRCSADPACKAFKMYMEANGSMSGCTKGVAGPLLPSSNTCWYTKLRTGGRVRRGNV